MCNVVEVLPQFLALLSNIIHILSLYPRKFDRLTLLSILNSFLDLLPTREMKCNAFSLMRFDRDTRVKYL
jgi:hypothetical protein